MKLYNPHINTHKTESRKQENIPHSRPNTTPRTRTPAKPQHPKHGNDAPTPLSNAKSTSTHTPNHDTTRPHPPENDPGRAESNPPTTKPPANIPLRHPKTPYT